MLIENQRKCKKRVQHGENVICDKNVKSTNKIKNLIIDCIFYTKNIEIRDNLGLAMRARNLKSPENTIGVKNEKSTKT